MTHELVRLHNIMFLLESFFKFAYSSKSTI